MGRNSGLWLDFVSHAILLSCAQAKGKMLAGRRKVPEPKQIAADDLFLRGKGHFWIPHPYRVVGKNFGPKLEDKWDLGLWTADCDGTGRHSDACGSWRIGSWHEIFQRFLRKHCHLAVKCLFGHRNMGRKWQKSYDLWFEITARCTTNAQKTNPCNDPHLSMSEFTSLFCVLIPTNFEQIFTRIVPTLRGESNCVSQLSVVLGRDAFSVKTQEHFHVSTEYRQWESSIFESGILARGSYTHFALRSAPLTPARSWENSTSLVDVQRKKPS